MYYMLVYAWTTVDAPSKFATTCVDFGLDPLECTFMLNDQQFIAYVIPSCSTPVRATKIPSLVSSQAAALHRSHGCLAVQEYSFSARYQ